MIEDYPEFDDADRSECCPKRHRGENDDKKRMRLFYCAMAEHSLHEFGTRLKPWSKVHILEQMWWEGAFTQVRFQWAKRRRAGFHYANNDTAVLKRNVGGRPSYAAIGPLGTEEEVGG